jgi:hypothetical protein
VASATEATGRHVKEEVPTTEVTVVDGHEIADEAEIPHQPEV